MKKWTESYAEVISVEKPGLITNLESKRFFDRHWNIKFARLVAQSPENFIILH